MRRCWAIITLAAFPRASAASVLDAGEPDRTGSDRHTGADSPPRAGFFVPAVRDSFCFLAWAPFRQHMRPGAYIGGQCLCGLPGDPRASAEKRPLESTLSCAGNTGRGGRAPCALLNVPRPVGGGPPIRPQCGGPRIRFSALRRPDNFLKFLFTSV